MSLVQFLRILFARRAIVLAALLSCVIVAMVISQLLPKRYQATARVMLDTVTPDPVTGVTIGNQYRAFAKTQTELIMDDQTAGRVVDQLGWTSDPTLIAQYAAATGGKGSDIRRWLAQRNIIDLTTAKLVETSNIIEITYSSTSPEAAKRVADLIRQTYIDLTLEIRRKSAQRNADWYRDQADKAKRLLVDAEAERSKYAKENGIVLQENNVDIEDAKLNALTGQSASAAAVPVGAAPSAVAPVGGASMQLEALNQQIAQAAQTLGPNHPGYQALLRQRTVVESAAARERAALSARGPGANVYVAQINSAYEAQKARVVGQRDKVDQLNQMNRDIEVKRDQYLKAAQRAADLRLQSTTAESGVSLLGDPTVPDKPTYPNVQLIMAGSTAFGAALGICLALLIELLGRRVRSDEDLVYAAKAPVFAIIGQPENGNSWYRRLGRWIQERAARGQASLAEAA